MQEEIWKVIPKTNGIYYASSFGRIKSIDHIVKTKCRGFKRIQKGRILKHKVTYKGYSQIRILIDGKLINTGVHRLVALAFIPNPYNKDQVNHIDGVKSNNTVDNLEWMSNKENCHHARQNNLMRSNYGENHHMAKFTNKQIFQFRDEFKLGKTISEIAKENNISITAMSNIIRNITYKHEHISKR